MSLDFEWIGEPITVDVEDKQLTAKPKIYYQYYHSRIRKEAEFNIILSLF